MNMFALATGVLFKAPEQRMSKSGKPFTTATLRVQSGDDASWLKLVAFAEPVQAELMHLTEGDAGEHQRFVESQRLS